MKVNAVPDSLDDDKYPYLENIRTYRDSSLTSRPQMTQTTAPPAAPNPILMMESQLGIYKVHDAILYSGAVFDTGYQPDVGCSILPFRPDASPTAWDYVFDIAKGTKVNVATGSPLVAKIGVAEPQNPPGAALLTSGWAEFLGSAVSWTAGGTAGAITNTNRISDTITAVFQDPSGIPASETGMWYAQVAASQPYKVGAMCTVNLIGGGTAEAMVGDVYPGVLGAGVQIQSIRYFSGATGRCVIVPTQQTFNGLPLGSTDGASLLNQSYITGLRRGALLQINAEISIISSVTLSPEGFICFEVSTTGAHVAGESLAGVMCVRLDGVNGPGGPTAPQLTGAGIVCSAITSNFTAGIGTMSITEAALGFNPFTSVAGPNEPTPREDDVIYVSVFMSDPSQLLDGRLIFDINTGDFLTDALYYSFRAADLEAAATSSQPQLQAVQQSVQRDYLLEQADAQKVTLSEQFIAGANAWAMFRIPISALTRVGSNETKSLNTLNAIRLSVNVAGNTTVALSVMAASLGHQMDVGDYPFGYYYCFRQRSSVTGARSNRSPITRYDLRPVRQAVLLLPDTTGLDPQCDLLDWFRQGVGLEELTYVGTQQWLLNSTFLDDYTDAALATTSKLETDNYEPWPSVDNPFQGIAAQVVGTTAVVQATGSAYVGRYLPGNLVQVGQQVYTLRKRPTPGAIAPVTLGVSAISYVTIAPQHSTMGTITLTGAPTLAIGSSFTFALTGFASELNGSTGIITAVGPGNQISFSIHPSAASSYSGAAGGTITGAVSGYLFEFEESAGTQTNANVTIYEPDVANLQHDRVWGPDAFGRFFSVGDTLRPGFISWTNPNNPDAASDANTYELSPPTEELQNGVILDGSTMVASPNRWWIGRPSATPSGYTWQELPVGAGLAAIWAIATDGERVFFWAKDGIREHSGGPSKSLTDEDLYLLFPHNGVLCPQPITFAGKTAYPPEYAYANSFRLTVCNGYLYADYLDATQTPRTLVCRLSTGAWSVDSYTVPISTRVVTTFPASNNQPPATAQRYQQLFSGGTNGAWYTEVSTPDPAGESVPWTVVTKDEIFGDLRAQKEIGDVMLDCVTSSGLTVQPISFGVNLGPLTTLAPIPARQEIPPVIPVGGLGVEVMSRTVGLLLQGTDRGPATILYAWQPAYIPQPEDATTRVLDWEDNGSPGAKWWQGFLLEANTYNVPKQLVVRNGDTLAAQAFQSSRIALPPGEGQHNGQQIVAYTFTPPFIAHLVRLEGADANTWQFFKVAWITEPSPEFGVEWHNQPTAHGFSGYQHVQQVMLAYNAPAPVSLVVLVDGVALPTVTFPATAGLAKVLQVLPPNKGLVYQYILTSTIPFQVWVDDIEVYVKPWGSPGPYQIVRQLGGEMSPAARI
jgi:hypothetical protein